MADNENTLYMLREAQKRGLLDQFTPEQRAQLMQKISPEMEAERKDALRSKEEIVNSEPKKNSFVDNLLAPIRSSFENPGVAAYNIAQGVKQSFNPAPLINLVNKGNPYAVPVAEDVEVLDAGFSFPIIRGAELTARLFLDDKDQPPLTTFAEVVNDHRNVSQQLSNITPGVREGTELGMAATGFYQLGSVGLKAAKNIARNAPNVVKKIATKVADYRAAKAFEKSQNLARSILNEGDGPILDAILRRPEKVKEIVDSAGDVSVNGLAGQLKDELETIGTELGKRVGKFRDAAFSDNKTRLKVSDDILSNLNLIKSRTMFEGKSVLPANIQKQLDMARMAANRGITTPNQAMVWIDTVDDIIDYAGSGKQGSNPVKSASNTLLAIRTQLKDLVRSSSGKGQQWAAADDAFSGYVNSSDGLIRRLESDSAESLVANLFSKNKTPLRNRLEASLDYMEKIDPTARGAGNAFFEKLANLRAGEKIKSASPKNMGVDRVNQERVNQIVRTWTQRGERVGMATGAGLGSVAGLISSGGVPGGALGGGVGMAMLKSIGAEAGQAVGMKLADPKRILDAAIKSKKLSNDATKLANDMKFLVQKFGPDASIALLDLVGPIPAVNELIRFTNKKGKGETNGVQK